jgi:uncharacterized protein (DUF302 family)
VGKSKKLGGKMKKINFKREVNATVEDAVKRVESAFRDVGFGILTRIDFHSKIKEKLNKDISPVVILGACNPQLALEAYNKNPDVTSLLPCNVVVRDIGGNKVSVEVVKPTALMEVLGDKELVVLAMDADRRLQQALETLEI